MTRASFRVLIGRAALHVLVHWRPYLLLVSAAFLLQGALFFFVRSGAALEIGDLVVLPVLTAASYALVGREFGLFPDVFRRVLARGALVVALDFLESFALSLALVSFAAGDTFTGVALLGVNVSLIYADVFAVFHDPPEVLLIARAVGRSTLTAWNGLDNIGRSIALVALQILPAFLVNQLQLQLAAHHVAFASFWAGVPLGTIVVPPLSALTALVYLDATGIQAQRTCGE
ncbi:MAG TPA: hypothetical protein VGN11_04155 [Candidatus Baltobacteraceae bacterium]|jgi:hypothetical protein|nr:hypothetical protein [Candidatus Baltobacteraceae bacterium]